MNRHDDPRSSDEASLRLLKTVVVTDSAAGLPEDEVTRHGITVVPLHLVQDGHEIAANLDDIMARIDSGGPIPTTACPSPEEFARAFGEAAARAKDVLAVLISSKMSATFSSAQEGARLAAERHPDTRIRLVDSGSNSMQEGFAALAAAECAARGEDIDACEAAATSSIARSRYLFAPESLDHLARGGRISGAAALVGSVLKIAPILTATDGTTGVAGIVRSYARALTQMAAMMAEDVRSRGLARVAVQFVGKRDAAIRFARERIEPIARRPVPVLPVAPVIAVHVGPAVGLAYETIEPPAHNLRVAWR